MAMRRHCARKIGSEYREGERIGLGVSAFKNFFSPLTNQRTDVYGYQTKTGMTYPLEVLAAVHWQ